MTVPYMPDMIGAFIKTPSGQIARYITVRGGDGFVIFDRLVNP